MATKLLDSIGHFCYHAPRMNVHHHPQSSPLHREGLPTGAIAPDVAAKAGLTDAAGDVKCPLCNCHTYPKGEWKEAEVHVDLCTDETVHYPRMHKAGKLSKRNSSTHGRRTLNQEELLGYYNRVPKQHVVAKLNPR